jgi:hypothetical protein
MTQQLKDRGRWASLVLLSILLGIPWYWPEDNFGWQAWLVPGWVWVTLVAAIVLSSLVVWGALRGWPEEPIE